MKLISLLVLLAACGGQSPSSTKSTAAVQPAYACVADRLPSVQKMDRDGSCMKESSCVSRCENGDAPACLEAAYALEQIGDNTNARSYYAKSCRAGFSVACTNLGAHLWAHGGSPDDVACATKLFQRACAARDVFGCGMQGRMLAENARTDADRADAKKFFDGICNDIGGTTCRMYALHVEKGDLGAPDAALSKALMIRACSTGDEDACGHETAGETFH